MFDPLRAAIVCKRSGDFDEACWLVFLAVNFGKTRRGGWGLLRDVYGRLGQRPIWDWATTSRSVSEFCNWIADHQEQLQSSRRAFGIGNHRKYESLRADSHAGTGVVVATYADWVGTAHTHEQLFNSALAKVDYNPHLAFHELYLSMRAVARFGRLGRFDYLAMIGNLRLASLVPDSAYLGESSGPLKGAGLLFGGGIKTKELDHLLLRLDRELGVGVQVLEDALCNWQKSPGQFRPFR